MTGRTGLTPIDINVYNLGTQKNKRAWEIHSSRAFYLRNEIVLSLKKLTRFIGSHSLSVLGSEFKVENSKFKGEKHRGAGSENYCARARQKHAGLRPKIIARIMPH